MSRRYRITLSDEWAEWVDDEAMHRGQSVNQLIMDALEAFQEGLVSAAADVTAEAFHGWERKRRLKERAISKLTEAERRVLNL